MENVANDASIPLFCHESHGTINSFAKTKNAITAKNCLHGYVVRDEEGTGKGLVIRLKLSYEYHQRSSWIKDWIFNHPRIVIPLLAAFAAFFAAVVFDPVRKTFVKVHITRSLHLSNNPILKWLTTRTSTILGRKGREEASGLNAIWSDRHTHIETIEKWLMETAETFIVVQGPRGSGKKELVLEQALKGRNNVLVIDCKPIHTHSSDQLM